MDFEKLLEGWVAAFTEAAEASLTFLENFVTDLAEHLAVPLQQGESFWQVEVPDPEPQRPNEPSVSSGLYIGPLGFGGWVMYTYVVPSEGCIGDPTCRYNAHSPELRCAVNPYGPCEGCPHYEKADGL